MRLHVSTTCRSSLWRAPCPAGSRHPKTSRHVCRRRCGGSSSPAPCWSAWPACSSDATGQLARSSDDATVSAGRRALAEAGVDAVRGRSAHQHLRDPQAPRALRRGAPAPRPGAAELGDQLRRRQRLPRVRQRHEPRREHDRVRADPLRHRRQRRGRRRDPGQHDPPAAARRRRPRGLHERVRLAHPRFGRRPQPSSAAPTSTPSGHRILGGVTRAATQFHELCVGSVDGMFTDAKALLKGGLDLVVSAWKEASAEWNWSSMDRYITHQVSSVHTNAIVKAREARPHPACRSTFPHVRQRRSGIHPDHARRRAGDPARRATACCSWASARA